MEQQKSKNPLWTSYQFKKLLIETDFNLVAKLIAKEFEGAIIEKKLANLFDNYLKNPCLETAVKLIKYQPEFLSIFKNCIKCVFL